MEKMMKKKRSGLLRLFQKQHESTGLLGLLGHDTRPKWKKWEQTPRAIRFIKLVWSYVGVDDFVALLFLLFGMTGYFWTPVPYFAKWSEFYHDNKAGFVGLGITVLILGNADQYIKTDMEKRRLIYKWAALIMVFLGRQ